MSRQASEENIGESKNKCTKADFALAEMNKIYEFTQCPRLLGIKLLSVMYLAFNTKYNLLAIGCVLKDHIYLSIAVGKGGLGGLKPPPNFDVPYLLMVKLMT